MSHPERGSRHEEEWVDEEDYHSARASGHSRMTEEHDQSKPTQSDQAPRTWKTSARRRPLTQPGGVWPWVAPSRPKPAAEGTKPLPPIDTSTPITSAMFSDPLKWPFRKPVSPNTSAWSSEPFVWPFRKPASAAKRVDDPPSRTIPRASSSRPNESTAAPMTWRERRNLSLPQRPKSVSSAYTDSASWSDADDTTVAASDVGDSPDPGWQSFPKRLAGHGRKLHADSPISPHTARRFSHDELGYAFDPSTGWTRSPDSAPGLWDLQKDNVVSIYPSSEGGQSSATELSRYPVSEEDPEPDFEGISIQQQPFSRPRPGSQRSSAATATTARRDSALLSPKPDSEAGPSPFLDPFIPGDAPGDGGLPSIRYVLDSKDEPIVERKFDAPKYAKDLATIDYLETLQKDSHELWQTARSATDSEKEHLMKDLVTRLWEASAGFLVDLLKSHKTLRQVATAHRDSLGEIDKLQQHSAASEDKASHKQRDLSIDVESLRRENMRLRLELALRDRETAESVSSGDYDVPNKQVKKWIGEQPIFPEVSTHLSKNPMPQDAVEEEFVKPGLDVEAIPERNPKDWLAMMQPIKEKPWIEATRRNSWEPNHDDTEELRQKIKQLREKVKELEYENELLDEQFDHLVLGERAAEEDARDKAITHSKAETAGLQAANQTLLKNLEVEQAMTKRLGKDCDDLDEQIAFKDHKTSKLEVDLDALQKELYQERRECNDAKSKLEELEADDLRNQIKFDPAEVSQLANEITALKKELGMARADLEEQRRENGDRIADLKDSQQNLEAAEDKYVDLIQDEVYRNTVEDLWSRIHELEALLDEPETREEDTETVCEDTEQEHEATEDNYAESVHGTDTTELLRNRTDELETLLDEYDDLEEVIEISYEDPQQDLEAMEDTDEALVHGEAYRDTVEKLWNIVHELENAVNEREANEDADTVSHLKTALKLSDECIAVQTTKIQEQSAEIKALKEPKTNPRGVYLKLEDLKKRGGTLQDQQAAWHREILELDRSRRQAELRYQQACKALSKAHQDLEKLQKERFVDPVREQQLLERLAFRDRESERMKLALQNLQLKLLSAEQLETIHEGAIADVESILHAFQEEVLGAGNPEYTNPSSQLGIQPGFGLTNTQLPPPRTQEMIVTRTVEHHHSDACFCSLIEYWFPGALESVLPRRRRSTRDSGYGSDSTDESEGVLGPGETPDSPTAQSDDGLHDEPRSEVPDIHTPANLVHFDYDGWGSYSLRGGAGSPDHTNPRASLDWDVWMASGPRLDGLGGGASQQAGSQEQVDEMGEQEVEGQYQEDEDAPSSPSLDDLLHIFTAKDAPTGAASKTETTDGSTTAAKSSPTERSRSRRPQFRQDPPLARRRVTFSDDRPLTSLLALIDSGLRTQPINLNAPDRAAVGDDIHTHLPRLYHGHTSDGPYDGPIDLLCQLLTAVTWLVMLVLSLPGNTLSTFGIITSYFFLPLGWIVSLAVYYIRVTLHTFKRWSLLLFTLHQPRHGRTRPPRPVFNRPSAAAIVSSVVSLMIVFLVVTLQALMYEREGWMRANSWTAAYGRDIMDQRPYPWWSPLDVDFRLVVRQWIGWKVNAFGIWGEYVEDLVRDRKGRVWGRM